jgi:Glycosyl transferase family 2/Methyltransferase domain
MTAIAAKFAKAKGATGRMQRECPLCGSAELDYEFIVENCPLCCCRDCSLSFLNPQPEPQETRGTTPVESGEGVYEMHAANASARLDQFTAYLGASAGRLLLVDLGETLRAEAIRRGFDVVTVCPSELENHALEDGAGTFAGCILNCALEQTSEPLVTLSRIRKLLSPGGCLMLVAPTLDSRTARLFRSTWWEFKRHNRYYFTSDTMQSLLLKAGFGDPIIMPDDSVVSLQYMRRKLAGEPPAWRWRLLRLLIDASPGFVRNKTFRFLHSRLIFMARPKSAAPTPRLSVILPLYNERSTFPQLMEMLVAKQIPGMEIEIILIESNSTDGSRDLALAYRDHPRVKLILEDTPKGKGHAVRNGLRVATGDVVLFQDADLEYDLDDYEGLIQPILSYRQNFVIGSRHNTSRRLWKIRNFDDAGGLTALFNVGHLIFLTLFNMVYRQRMSDPFSMYKVFRRECLYGLHFECNRFDFDWEIVIKLLRKGYRPLELPVNYRSRSFTEGKKVTILGDPITWLRALVKYRNCPLYDLSTLNAPDDAAR